LLDANAVESMVQFYARMMADDDEQRFQGN
jgi:hypothetical protein